MSVLNKTTSLTSLADRQGDALPGQTQVDRPTADATDASATDKLALELLQQTFATEFALLDVELMQALVEPTSALQVDWARWMAVCREVSARGEPAILEDMAPVAILAVPLTNLGQPTLVATAAFCTQGIRSQSEALAASEAIGCNHEELCEWLDHATPWHPDSLLNVARLAVAHLLQSQQAEKQNEELLETSSHLLTTYEEISLLHRLTENLSLSSSEGDLAEKALGWLADVLPAEAVIMRLCDVGDGSTGQMAHAPTDLILTRGALTLGEPELQLLVDELTSASGPRPIVFNQLPENRPNWPLQSVRDAVLVPVLAEERARGWLLAINHTGDLRLGSRDFGSVEARLLGSVATILAIHGSNIGLFREQAAFFEEVVRALTSAIDAKDPYTCGHSDRVARVSVCLARELGLDATELNTVYLSGLLHDIGKIGINDTVLRKPDRLTKEEFEHIKTHPELGYKILKGIKRLDKALPVVLHHHEAWDGSGYPHGLKGDNIPRLARICAVADAFDAMGSDRPYRAGMPDEKLDAILCEGAGKQWDADVITAFFAVREEIRQIAEQERNPLSLNVHEWQQ